MEWNVFHPTVFLLIQVTNTPWGERVSFLFDPEGQTVPKSLHVSPFMDMQSVWTLKATPPSATLKLSVLVTHPVHGQFFDAVLSLQRCGSHALRSEQSGLMTFWRCADVVHINRSSLANNTLHIFKVQGCLICN